MEAKEMSKRMERPPLQFMSELKSLADIVGSGTLPCVVKSSNLFDPFNSKFQVDQPLLLYKKRSVRKVNAQSIYFDTSIQEFVPFGSDLMIPVDYSGWFAVLGHRDDVKSNIVVPHHTTVSRLAISPCTQFLIGGDQPIQASQMNETGNKIVPSAHKLFPGDVLRKGSNFTTTVKDKSSGIFKRSKEQKNVMFLSCYDKDDRQLFLPASTTGVFYILTQNDAPLKTPIMRVSSILQRYKFPVIVKLISGNIPNIQCGFTGTIILTSSVMDHVVIASTILNVKNINLEIPISKKIKFEIAENNPGLLASHAYQSAFSMCQEKAESYATNIKVIVNDSRSGIFDTYNSVDQPAGPKDLNSSFDSGCASKRSSTQSEENQALDTNFLSEDTKPFSLINSPSTKREPSFAAAKNITRDVSYIPPKPNEIIEIQSAQSKHEKPENVDDSETYEFLWKKEIRPKSDSVFEQNRYLYQKSAVSTEKQRYSHRPAALIPIIRSDNMKTLQLNKDILFNSKEVEPSSSFEINFNPEFEDSSSENGYTYVQPTQQKLVQNENTAYSELANRRIYDRPDEANKDFYPYSQIAEEVYCERQPEVSDQEYQEMLKLAVSLPSSDYPDESHKRSTNKPNSHYEATNSTFVRDRKNGNRKTSHYETPDANLILGMNPYFNTGEKKKGKLDSGVDFVSFHEDTALQNNSQETHQGNVIKDIAAHNAATKPTTNYKHTERNSDLHPNPVDNLVSELNNNCTDTPGNADKYTVLLDNNSLQDQENALDKLEVNIDNKMQLDTIVSIEYPQNMEGKHHRSIINVSACHKFKNSSGDVRGSELVDITSPVLTNQANKSKTPPPITPRKTLNRSLSSFENPDVKKRPKKPPVFPKSFSVDSSCADLEETKENETASFLKRLHLIGMVHKETEMILRRLKCNYLKSLHSLEVHELKERLPTVRQKDLDVISIVLKSWSKFNI